MTKIKICGVMNDKDAEIINQTHPDFAGFVFASGRHQINTEQSIRLRNKIAKSIQTVGVFTNEDFSLITKLYDLNVIQIAQLHGNQSEEFVRALSDYGIPIIRVFKPKEQLISYTNAKYIMVDSENGSGKPLDWQRLPQLNSQNLFVAGGLNPNNEFDIIKNLHPYALDVSSGVELNGKKNFDLVDSMVRNAHMI